MVSFYCDNCGDTIKKPKLDNHVRSCRPRKVSCIDCSKEFDCMKAEYASHTSCVSEAEKYQKALYKGPKAGQQQNKQQQNGGNQKPQQQNGKSPAKPEDKQTNGSAAPKSETKKRPAESEAESDDEKKQKVSAESSAAGEKKLKWKSAIRRTLLELSAFGRPPMAFGQADDNELTLAKLKKAVVAQFAKLPGQDMSQADLEAKFDKMIKKDKKLVLSDKTAKYAPAESD
eukprot:tig00000383_g24632.t1